MFCGHVKSILRLEMVDYMNFESDVLIEYRYGIHRCQIWEEAAEVHTMHRNISLISRIATERA